MELTINTMESIEFVARLFFWCQCVNGDHDACTTFCSSQTPSYDLFYSVTGVRPWEHGV